VNEYENFEQLLADTLEANPIRKLKIKAWAPDGRWSLVRAVQIERVGWTQTERRRFRHWSETDLREMVCSYIGIQYNVPTRWAQQIVLDIEWSDDRYLDYEILT
jgi:hypothetical protein